MEFYTPKQLGKLILGCFNSQRDGILLSKKPLVSLLYSIVSIPNGMEFYSRVSYILPLDTKFQFPTGWNSTHQAKKETSDIIVSIPNGMEFYQKAQAP